MSKFQYKERTYAKEIMSKGFITKHIKYELQLLVKYYKELGCKPKERKELIYQFCEKYLDGFDRVIHFKLINSVLNNGKNKSNVLVEIENIPLTKEELNYINNLEIDHDYKKVIFTLLVLDKLNKQYHEIKNDPKSNEHYFGGAKKYKELIDSSKITLKQNKQIHNIIGELSEIRVIEILGNSSIKLSFIYNIPESEEILFSIKSFDNIGYYYDLHTDENKVKKCECCETPIKPKNNKNKYCEKCAKEKELERQRIKWHNNKSKYRSAT
jgi:hypothetical protein